MDASPVVRRALVGSLAWMGAVVIGLAPRVSAQSPGGHPDVDGDGLVYAQEHILGTSPIVADTDQDGFSDLEEIARHSSPISAISTPDLTRRLGIGMAAHAQSDGVHVLVSVFMSDMNLRDKQVQIGLYGHNQLIALSNSYLAAHAVLTYHPASVQAGCIALIDVTLDPNIVHAAGHLTVWASGGVPGANVATSAATCHLLSIAGVIVWAMPVQRAGSTNNSKDAGEDSVYMPLLPAPTGGGSNGGNGSGSGSGGAPASWEPGQVCFQHSATVGADGASVVNEVISASCVAGWEGFCPPSCASSVGSTYRTVDPLVLIGG